MRVMFGRCHRYVRQGEGDLGARLVQGFEAAARAGAERIIAVGADCPSLSHTDIQQAFHELASSDVVIGPSSDGGYYLIGMREPCRTLFADIPWGTAAVFDATLSRAREQRLSVAVLDTKTDIDEPNDLWQWRQSEAAASGRDTICPTLSIVIPTVNEADNLPDTLAVLGDSPHIEIIVADAGSTDATVLCAEQAGARVLHCERGRALQMNAGADAARASTLLFLHADTRPPFGYREQIDLVLSRTGVVAGAFRLAFDDTRPAIKLIERVAGFRSKHLQVPYGDQGLFLRRDTFEKVGGFEAVPILEDWLMVKTLRELGRIETTSAAAITSSRRWRNEGTLKTTALHWLILTAYSCGVDPQRLARWRSEETQNKSI